MESQEKNGKNGKKWKMFSFCSFFRKTAVWRRQPDRASRVLPAR